jgi:hypothetical protein
MIQAILFMAIVPLVLTVVPIDFVGQLVEESTLAEHVRRQLVLRLPRTREEQRS